MRHHRSLLDLFKRLTALPAGPFYRFEHIVAYSSFKAHSKQRAVSTLACFFVDNGRCMFCPGSGTKQAQPWGQDAIATSTKRDERYLGLTFRPLPWSKSWLWRDLSYC